MATNQKQSAPKITVERGVPPKSAITRHNAVYQNIIDALDALPFGEWVCARGVNHKASFASRLYKHGIKVGKKFSYRTESDSVLWITAQPRNIETAKAA